MTNAINTLSITKILSEHQLAIVDLLLSGSLAPVNGFLAKADLQSVIQHQRLSNGRLAPLPLALPITSDEAALLAANNTAPSEAKPAVIHLLDKEHRLVAQVEVDEVYSVAKTVAEKLPLYALSQPTQNNQQTWLVGGRAIAKQAILKYQFRQSRPTTASLKTHFAHKGWQRIIAVQANPNINEAQTKRACEWLYGSRSGGGLIIQAIGEIGSEGLTKTVRQLRHNIRCSAAKDTKLVVLPKIEGLSALQETLLFSQISRHSGATGIVLDEALSHEDKSWLLRHQDELGLAIVPAKALRRIQKQQDTEALVKAA